MGDSGNISASAGSGGSTTTSTALAIGAAGGLTKAYGQYRAGRYNRQVADINAKLALQQEKQALQAGTFQANRAAIREHQVEAADAAAAAGGGVLARSGSNAAVIASNQAASALDEHMIQMNARREAYGFKVRAAAETQAGQMAQKEGNNAAIETLLNTGTNTWQTYQSDRIRFSTDGEPESTVNDSQSYIRQR